MSKTARTFRLWLFVKVRKVIQLERERDQAGSEIDWLKAVIYRWECDI